MLRAVAGTTLVYAVLGWLALQITLPPALASPIYPAAGIGLAAAITFGWPGAIGAGLGALLANGIEAFNRGTLGSGSGALVPAAIGLGAALQALVGAALARRHAGPQLRLDRPSEVMRFALVGGATGCLVSTSVAHVALVGTGALPLFEAPMSWLTWWIGDLLGVMIAAPIMLALIGRPRTDWAPRRLNVALPMLLGSLLLALAAWQFHRWEAERLRDTFDRFAGDAIGAVEQRLVSARQALQAVHGALGPIGEDAAAVALPDSAAWWLARTPELQAIGHARRLPRSQVVAYEARLQAGGLASYRIFDRPDGAAAAAGDGDVIAIDAIEPRAGNTGALGVNVLSEPAARAAIERAVASGEAAATQAFVLTQSKTRELGVVVYLPIYRGRPATAEQRQSALRALVFVTLRPDAALREALGSDISGVRWCLVDRAQPSPPLAGDDGGCAAAAASFERRQELRFAGRDWELRLSARAGELPGGQTAGAWLLSMVGLAATALLGMLLLVVTGRARRIEEAVQLRTAELSNEVGERRSAEEALRDREQRLRSLYDNVPIGIVYADLDGRVLEVNPRLCELLGRSEAVLQSMTLTDLSQADDWQQDLAWRQRLLAGEIPGLRVDKRYPRADGSVFPARLTLTLLRDADGRPYRMAGVVEDLSEHQQLERSEQARAKAEAASRAKTEFVSRMSHELRTPLNAMLGFAQLLGLDKTAPLAGHQRAWAEQIQRAGWHLLDMINDTLDLARIESGAVGFELQPVAVKPLIEASRELLAPLALRRQVQIIEELPAAALAVKADETRFKQILSNLLSNAVKYNRDGGRVVVRALAAPAGRVTIEVEDNGLGMTESQLGSLFQPFNRLGREASGVEGTGIGLVICRRLAEAMGGTLEASSRAGQGSVFTLVLPRATASDITNAPSAVDTTIDSSYHHRVIHYVEDNETNVELIRGVLGKRPQVALEVSGNGLDGLAAIRARPPDLVLLDMNLPDIDGLELLRHLKSNETTSGVPVIVISADAERARIQQALSLGAARYLTKPIDFGSFLSAVDEALEAVDTRWG
jgi:PAS domain S-box-containing protein